MILKKTVSIFLLVFYSFGTFCLPVGDFSVLKDLPQMYQHCKTTEDKDMTLLDFITDHLINIDGVFDKHDNADKQKPHQPVQYQQDGCSVFSFVSYFPITFTQFYTKEKKQVAQIHNFIPSGFISTIFRPPIV